MRNWLDALVNKYKFFRRALLVWAATVITLFIFSVVDKELLLNIGTPGASVVLGIIGILTTAIGFYPWSRNSEDESSDDD